MIITWRDDAPPVVVALSALKRRANKVSTVGIFIAGAAGCFWEIVGVYSQKRILFVNLSMI